MPPRPSHLRGALLGLAAMGLFACSDVTVKFLGGGYDAFQILFFAGIMSVPLVAGLAMADPAAAPLRPRNPRLMAVRAVVVLLNGILGTYAFATLPLAQCYAIFFTMPIFITLLAVPVLGEKIDLVRGAAVLVGLGGVVVALNPGAATLGWGHAAALAGALLGAANYVILRKSGGTERTVVMILYPLMLQLLVAAVVLPLVYLPMPLRDLALTGFMAVVSFAGYLLIIAAYRAAPAIIVAPMQYSQILWAAVLGTLLFDEVPGLHVLFGTALIIAAGVAIVARRDKAV